MNKSATMSLTGEYDDCVTSHFVSLAPRTMYTGPTQYKHPSLNEQDSQPTSLAARQGGIFILYVCKDVQLSKLWEDNLNMQMTSK